MDTINLKLTPAEVNLIQTALLSWPYNAGPVSSSLKEKLDTAVKLRELANKNRDRL